MKLSQRARKIPELAMLITTAFTAASTRAESKREMDSTSTRTPLLLAPEHSGNTLASYLPTLALHQILLFLLSRKCVPIRVHNVLRLPLLTGVGMLILVVGNALRQEPTPSVLAATSFTNVNAGLPGASY